MFGLIGRIIAEAGKRDELAQILIEGASCMPGCRSYTVALDATDQDSVWITEVWESQEAHQASLALKPVQDAIASGRPLIAGFGERFETAPVGGYGIQEGV